MSFFGFIGLYIVLKGLSGFYKVRTGLIGLCRLIGFYAYFNVLRLKKGIVTSM